MPTTTPTVWLSPVQVNTTDSGPSGNAQTKSEVIALSNGRFMVAWADDTDTFGLGAPDIYGRLGSPLGTYAANDRLLNSFIDFEQGPPRLAALPNGGFTMVYELSTDPIFGLGQGVPVDIFDSSATQVFNPNGPWINNTEDETNPAIAAFADGRRVVVFEDNAGGDKDIRAVVMTAAGAFGAEFDVATGAGDQTLPDVALLGASAFVTVFGNGGGIDFAIRSTAGVLNASGTIASGAAAQEDASVAALSGGGFVAVWEELAAGGGATRDIRARIYTSAGAALPANPSAFTANTATAGDQIQPAVAALADGGFAIVWVSGSELRGQRFDAAGVKIGVEFLIASGAVADPDIALLGDGRFAVSYTLTTAGDSDIYLAILDPREATISGTTGNDVLTGRQDGGTVIGREGHDTLYGGAAADILNGGAGDDILIGGAGADQLIGGPGSDTASYAGAAARVKVALDGSIVFEGDALGDTFSSIARLTGTGSSDVLIGDLNANVINGGGSNDNIRGKAGNDLLRGGRGADILGGGAGNDRFGYTALDEGGDTIIDFSNAVGDDDSFEFRGSAFGGLAAGALDPSRFTANTSGLATTADHRFIYETDTGILRFDANGTGADGVTVIATLNGAPAVTAADIAII